MSDTATVAAPAPSTPRRRAFRLPESLIEALWLLVTLRIALSLFALMVSLQFTLPSPCHYEEAFNNWRTMPTLHKEDLDFRLLGLWQRWDACWYHKIAELGYETGENSTAFFPLLPASMSAVGVLVGGHLTLAALIVVGVAYVAAIVGLYRLVARDFDEHTARNTVLYLSVFPSAFFLFAPFTEALFLALAVWAIEAARRRAWGLAAIAALLAGFARTQGFLLALPLAWEAVCELRRRSETLRGAPWRSAAGALVPLLVALAPFVGLLAFTRYAEATTGTTPFEAQRLWGSNYYPPWTVVQSSWDWIWARDDPIQALNLALLLLFAALVGVGLRWLPFTYSLYAAPQLLSFGLRLNPTPLTSTSRYVLLLFPAFVVLALLWGRHRRLHTSWLIFSLLFLGLLTYHFLRGDFVA